jgi:hypothetical protein
MNLTGNERNLVIMSAIPMEATPAHFDPAVVPTFSWRGRGLAP